MKLLFFEDFRVGVLKEDAVVEKTPLVQEIPHTGPHNLISGLIERFGDFRPKLEEAAAKGGGIPFAAVRIRAPLSRPGKLDCMAVNYKEDGTRAEPAPINAFHKTPNAVIGHGDTMVLVTGFWLYMLAILTNNFNFGLLTGLALLFALLADFFLAPAMLALVIRTRYGREVALPWGSSGSRAALAGEN